MGYSNKVSLAGESIVGAVVVVGLYVLSSGTQSAPLQIPAYLLIVGFDVLEAVFGPLEANYYVLFYVYLLGLGVVGVAVVHGLRKLSSRTDRSMWRLGVSGALTIVGALSLLFGLSVLVGATQLEPAVITGVTGLLFLTVAGWLSGVFGALWDQ